MYPFRTLRLALFSVTAAVCQERNESNDLLHKHALAALFDVVALGSVQSLATIFHVADGLVHEAGGQAFCNLRQPFSKLVASLLLALLETPFPVHAWCC